MGDIVDDRLALRNAFIAVTAIKSHATAMLAMTGNVNFAQVSEKYTGIVRTYQAGIAPLGVFTAQQINDAVARQYPLGTGANTHAGLVAVGTAVTAFRTAFTALLASAGNLQTINAAGEIVQVEFPASSLSSLTASLNAIVAACVPTLEMRAL
jgi:hypothetical protein